MKREENRKFRNCEWKGRYQKKGVLFIIRYDVYNLFSEASLPFLDNIILWYKVVKNLKSLRDLFIYLLQRDRRLCL